MIERRKFIRNIVATAVAGSLLNSSIPMALASTNNADTPSKKEEGTIVHYVLFWLKENLSEKEIQYFTGFFEELKKVPTIKSLYYGPAIQTNPRPVVDNSFSYNLIVHFKNKEDLDIYESHPIHLAAIEKYSKNWTKVMVHDSVVK